MAGFFVRKIERPCYYPAMRKGEDTRARILAAARLLAGQIGLEGLSLGVLAERLGLSKSGVYAHFGSKEDLQIAILAEVADQFRQQVIEPAFRAPRGVARLKLLFDRWLAWGVDAAACGGCPYVAAAAEYDDRPGPVRDELVHRQRQWRQSLLRTVQMAVDNGDLAADTDVGQFAFEMAGIFLALHHDARLLDDAKAPVRARRAFHRLLLQAGHNGD